MISALGSSCAEPSSAQPFHLPLHREAGTQASALNTVDFHNTLLCIFTHNTGMEKGTTQYCCRGEPVPGAEQAVHPSSQTPKMPPLGQPVISLRC